jgi:hypothetical protein
VSDERADQTTPEGQTPEQATTGELGATGTPGAGLSPTAPHPADVEDDDGHAEPRQGPIDWGAWGFAAIGVAAGLLVAVLFYAAIS